MTDWVYFARHLYEGVYWRGITVKGYTRDIAIKSRSRGAVGVEPVLMINGIYCEDCHVYILEDRKTRCTDRCPYTRSVYPE